MTCKEAIETLKGIINRLGWELYAKDIEALYMAIDVLKKLEQQKYIELPCKAGDTLYTIHKFKNGEDRFYYMLEENPSIPIRGVYELACDFATGSCVFYSNDKLEAEAKLKEINNEY